MNFTFDNQGNLVYAVGEDDTIDSMSLGMLTNNNIPGIARAMYTQMDANKFIKYNISSHISVKQFFSGPVNKKRLLGVFKGIVDAMLSAEDYMIDINTILMDLDYIFADVSTCDTVLICLPILSLENKTVDLGEFFKNIIFSVQYDQTEDCGHVARIITYLSSTPNFSLTDFKELLLELENSASTPVPQPVQQPGTQSSAPVQPVTPVAPVQPPVETAPVVPKPQPIPTTPAQPVKPIPQSAPSQPVKPISQTPVAPAGMKIPNAPAQPVVPTADTKQAPAEDGKKMSFFYLMQHYNKENAAAYKAQKEAKKSGAAVAQPMAQPGPMPGKAPVKPMATPGNFAVPGQATPVPMPNKAAPMPVPGKAPVKPMATPGNFAVPGQAAPTPMPNKAVPIPGKAPIAQPMVQPTVQPVAQPVVPVQQAPVIPHGNPANFGETTVLGASGSAGETTVLGANTEVKQTPYLIRIKNNEKINLVKNVFVIGKEKSYADYCISDNPAISRSHANIISRDGQLFIMDTNSTNHTYVNGSMVQSNVEFPLSHGDKVRLANEDFEFKLY